MRRPLRHLAPLVLALPFVAGAGVLAERNETLCGQIKEVHHLTDAQTARIRAVFKKSGFIGQGNPAITEHPMTP